MRVPGSDKYSQSSFDAQSSFDDVVFGSAVDDVVEEKQNTKTVLLFFIATLVLLVCALAAGIIITDNWGSVKSQDVQSTATAQSAQGISYQPEDFEYSESRCAQMYTNKDNHLLWSCAQGTLELGTPSTEKYPDNRTELPLSVPLYDQTSVSIDPATIQCYDSQLCTAPGNLNGHKVLYVFALHDPLVQAVYFSYEDATHLSNAEITEIAQHDRVVPSRYKGTHALYIGFQFSPVYSCVKTDCTVTGTTSLTQVKE